MESDAEERLELAGEVGGARKGFRDDGCEVRDLGEGGDDEEDE
jgi:hypothetical protein